MATKKKLDFDFSKFGCQADDVKELTEAMGFEAVKDEGIYVSPLDKVKDASGGRIMLVVTRELQGLEFPDDDDSWERFIPVVETNNEVPKVNGIHARYLVTLDGKKILGFKD